MGAADGAAAAGLSSPRWNSFSPELADLTIYVIDVAGGEKIPRKGGPGITRSDLLIINKTDLAPHVGADLAVMAQDARRQRYRAVLVPGMVRRGPMARMGKGGQAGQQHGE